jgi:hypothetical protein
MDVCLRVSVLCCPVSVRPCVGLIPRPRSPTKMSLYVDREAH